MTKEYVLQQLPRLYRKDPWIAALFSAAGFPADAVAPLIADLYNAQWFDTMPERYVAMHERRMGITPRASQTLADRRAAIEAKWKSNGKISLAALQAVADAWRNGETEISFPNGRIRVQFVGAFGVPEDMDSLKAAIRQAAPAHLPVDYVLKYLLIRDIHEKMTVSELETQLLSNFAS